MPDENDYDDDVLDEESTVIKNLRKQVKGYDDLQAEATTMRARIAILEAPQLAGLSSLQQQAVLKMHDGPLEADALLQTAIGLKFVSDEPEAPEPPQVSANEQAAHQRMADTSAAAQPSEAHTLSVDQQIAAATSPEEVKAILVREQMVYSD